MYKLLMLTWFWYFGQAGDLLVNKLGTPTTKTFVVANTDNQNINLSEPVLLPLVSDSTKSCADCHGDMLDAEVVHAPAKKDCQRCHISTGAEHPKKGTAGFALKTNVPNLCYECHDPKNEKEFVHKPAGEGQCFKCHDPHKSPNTYLVKADPIGGICQECHDLNIPEGNMVHGAVTEGQCVGCHNPHQSDDQRMLKTTRLDRLCRSCHKPIRKELKMAVVHDPFKKKDCFSCHNPHSSKDEHLSDLKTQDLCFSCHDDVHNEITAAAVPHDAVKEGLACLNCHVPHASGQEHILFTDEKAVCLTCHDKAIEKEDRTIAAISPSLADGNVIHGPIRMDQCAVCHKPHGSDKHTLLTMKFPDEQYTVAETDNFELCFNCHNKALFESPTTESATNFRNGNQNLHYLHIRGSRGRNCNLCHDVHGSKNEYMIRQKTRYGNWLMPVKFEHSEKGGSCQTGCHERKAYTRLVLPDSVNVNK